MESIRRRLEVEKATARFQGAPANRTESGSTEDPGSPERAVRSHLGSPIQRRRNLCASRRKGQSLRPTGTSLQRPVLLPGHLFRHRRTPRHPALRPSLRRPPQTHGGMGVSVPKWNLRMRSRCLARRRRWRRSEFGIVHRNVLLHGLDLNREPIPRPRNRPLVRNLRPVRIAVVGVIHLRR